LDGGYFPDLSPPPSNLKNAGLGYSGGSETKIFAPSRKYFGAKTFFRISSVPQKIDDPLYDNRNFLRHGRDFEIFFRTEIFFGNDLSKNLCHQRLHLHYFHHLLSTPGVWIRESGFTFDMSLGIFFEKLLGDF
jgi:hypothetical protein